MKDTGWLKKEVGVCDVSLLKILEINEGQSIRWLAIYLRIKRSVLW